MEYDLTNDLILFRPVIKVYYINNYKEIIDLIQMGLFLICQGMWGYVGFERHDSPREELLVINAQEIFCWLLFFVGINFHTKKNHQYARYLLLKYLNAPLPKFHHELTCYHNCILDEGEKTEQDENWGGVCCKGKGWRDGGEHKGGKNQEDEERGGGMCPCFGGEEEMLSSIQIWE